MGISPKAAAAATFTPRGSGTQKPGRKERRVAPQGSQVEGTVTPASASHSKAPSNEFVPQQNFQNTFQEFVPQNFVSAQQVGLRSSGKNRFMKAGLTAIRSTNNHSLVHLSVPSQIPSWLLRRFKAWTAARRPSIHMPKLHPPLARKRSSRILLASGTL